MLLNNACISSQVLKIHGTELILMFLGVHKFQTGGAGSKHNRFSYYHTISSYISTLGIISHALSTSAHNTLIDWWQTRIVFDISGLNS